MSLKSKAVSGFAWTTMNEGGAQLLKFAVGLILARILAPEDFGLLALVSVFAAITHAIADSGFRMAIIQKSRLSDIDKTTAFWYNILVGALVVSLLFVCAPLVASFYQDERLVALVRAMGVSVLLQSFSGIHAALFERDMRFRESMMIQLPAILVGGVVGVVSALAGMGVWALIFQAWTMSAMLAVFFWLRSGWSPGFQVNAGSARSLFAFGWKVALERIVDVSFREAYILVIGKVFTPVQVGYYHRGSSFQQLVSRNLHRIVSRVSFPVLASIQSDPDRMGRVFRSALRVLAILSFPVFAGMIAIAEPLILTLIGAQWLPSVPVLQMLSIVGVLWPLQALNLSILLATGDSGLSLKLAILKRGLMVVAIIFTFRHGLYALLAGQVVVAILSWIINTWPARRLISCPIETQTLMILPYAISSALMGLIVWLLVGYLEYSPLVELTLGTLVGVVLYASMLRLMPCSQHTEIVQLTDQIPIIRRLARVVFA